MLEVNPEEILSTIKNLKSKISNYESHIEELSSLSKKIEGSSDWVDETVKPSFINYLNSYIEIYKAIHKSLTSYASFLEKKVKNFSENEDKFS